MIVNIKHKGLADLYYNDQTKGVMQIHVARLKRILFALETAKVLSDMDIPRFKLHPLLGKMKGFHAVSVSGNWRVVFRFEDGDIYDVDLVDYH